VQARDAEGDLPPGPRKPKMDLSFKGSVSSSDAVGQSSVVNPRAKTMRFHTSPINVLGSDMSMGVSVGLKVLSLAEDESQPSEPCALWWVRRWRLTGLTARSRPVSARLHRLTAPTLTLK
jgi:hypothetical protein